MSFVNYEQRGDIALITMDDGKVNAMSSDMIAEVNGALDQAEKAAKAVIIMGRPGVFCGGYDLKTIRSGDDAAREAMTLAGAHMAMRIYGCPKPTIMANTGHGIALGGLLLLTGDYRIGVAGEFAIGMNEVAIGLTLPAFALMLVQARIANRHLSNAVISATMYGPEEAVQAGFLDEVVEPDDLLTRAMEKASTLAELDGDAFARVKQDIRGASIEKVLESL
jgi:enoyl-CoA hydratase